MNSNHANRSITNHRDALSNAQRDRLENGLASAEAAYDQARDRQRGTAERASSEEPSEVKRAVTNRGRALDQYGTAWKKATDVLDLLESYDVESSGTDTDGDGLVDSRERELGTNATNNDSDGDGIPDGAEIDLSVKTDAGYGIVSDPRTADSDGDGLADAEEQEGWEAELVTNRTRAEAYDTALDNESQNASQYLATKRVTSDPLSTDTDGDGVDDLTEFVRRSDPSSTDSDGDGIPDADEQEGDTEITIHDHTAPQVTVRSIETGGAARTSYNVTLRLTDESGLGETHLYKQDERQYTIHGQGREEFGYLWASFEVERDLIEKIHVGAASFVTGASVDIEATDVHGNSQRRTVSGPDSFGQAARVIENSPVGVGEREGILLTSFSSGVTTVVGQAVLGLVELVKNPQQFVDSMQQLATFIANNPSKLAELPKLMLEQIQETQDQRNPFPDGETGHGTFATGWYTATARAASRRRRPLAAWRRS